MIKNNNKDNWILVRNLTIVKFIEVINSNKFTCCFYVGKRDFYKKPLRSSKLFIFADNETPSSQKVSVSINDIFAKLIKIPNSTGTVVFFSILRSFQGKFAFLLYKSNYGP